MISPESETIAGELEVIGRFEKEKHGVLIFQWLLILASLFCAGCHSEIEREVGRNTSAKAISALCSPSKLAALKPGNRAANQRFRKLMFYVNQADERGVLPKAYIAQIYGEFKVAPYAGKKHVYAPETERQNLEAQYRLGKIYGLYTADNLKLLKRGRSPFITRGEYQGEKAEVDHLIPVKIAPELECSMANLGWLPKSVNRKKSAKFTNAAKRRVKRLQEEVGLKPLLESAF